MEQTEAYQENSILESPQGAKDETVIESTKEGEKRVREDNGSEGIKKQKLEAEGEEKQDCKFWLKGQCKFGDKCRSLHDPEGPIKAQAKAAGKELCKFFQTGKCKFGDRCKAFHPRSFMPSSLSALSSSFNPLSPAVLQQQLVAATQLQIQLQQQLLLSQQQQHQQRSSSSSFISPFSMGIQSQKPLRLSSSSSSSSRPSRSSIFSSSSSTSTRSKNEVCKYFLKGDCKFGQRCELSHATTVPSVSSIPRLEPSRPPPSPSSSIVPAAPLTSRPAQKQPKDPNQVCEYFLRGICKFGSQCLQRHFATSMQNGSSKLGRSVWDRPSAYSAQQSLNPYVQTQHHQQQRQGSLPFTQINYEPANGYWDAASNNPTQYVFPTL